VGRGIYNDGGNRNLPMKQKRCPRCGGFLALDEDDCGKYLTCMGCARSFDLEGKPLEVPQFIKDEKRCFASTLPRPKLSYPQSTDPKMSVKSAL